MKEALVIAAGAPEHSAEPEFKLPKGVDLGELKPGETVETVVTLRAKEDGMVCVEAVEGVPVSGHEESESEDTEDREEHEASETPDEEAVEEDAVAKARQSGKLPPKEDGEDFMSSLSKRIGAGK